MDKKIANLYDAGKIDRAIHLLIKKIDAHPAQVDNYLQLSSYLLEQGSVDQASKLLEEAIHLVKKPKDLYYNLAVCYYTQGQNEKALNLLSQLPNDDLTLYQKALVYLKVGQNQKALAYALTIKKTDEKVQELLGDIWLSLGDTKRANVTYQKIPENKRTAKIYFLMGVSEFAENRNKAEKDFNQAKKMDPAYFKRASSQYSDLLNLIRGKK